MNANASVVHMPSSTSTLAILIDQLASLHAHPERPEERDNGFSDGSLA